MGCGRSIVSLDFPLFAKWYITGKCNLRCRHCYLTDYTKEPDIKLLESIIAYMAQKGLSHISFLGGEPLARNDFAEIVDTCTRHGVKTKLATNGTLLNAETVGALKAAGLKHVQVSLEGHSPELSDPIRGEGTFDKAIEGIAELKRFGMWASISITLSHENVGSLGDIYKRAALSGVDEIKLAAGTGAFARDRFMLKQADVEFIKSELPKLRSCYPSANLNTAFVKRRRSSPIKRCTFGCGAGTNSIVINDDLSISACDILTQEDKTFETIEKPEDIEYIWKNHKIFKKWRGECEGETPTIESFKGVHLNGCHVAYSTYKENILA